MEAKRIQGDQGFATAISFYMIRHKFIVSVPLTEACRYDLVVDKGSGPLRVQVKSTKYMPNGKEYTVQLRTSGGANNKSAIKKISADECDLVFVSSEDGHCWEFPVIEVAGKNSVTLNESREKFLVGQFLFETRSH